MLCGSAVGGYCGAAQLSAVANGHHNPTVDQPFAGAVTGAVVGALGVPCFCKTVAGMCSHQ